jgi:ABC-type antimicrobial peptide transport system permease subunit
MRSLRYAIAGAVLALVPLAAEASVNPSPSPTLDKILVAPPSSDYLEATSNKSGLIEGPFDAAQYATSMSSNPAQAQATLVTEGFVSGYGRNWVSLATQQVLVEQVVAFTGGDGAKLLLARVEVADKADATYQHELSITGIDSYTGAHFYDAASILPNTDGFAFVKGNDYFSVLVTSGKDDTGAFAASQARRQYAFAPDYTIPPSQWPRAASASNTNAVIGRILVLGIIGLSAVVLIILRNRRRPA